MRGVGRSGLKVRCGWGELKNGCVSGGGGGSGGGRVSRLRI